MWQNYLYLPPGVDGQLNWIGGFIQLDETVEEREEIEVLAKENATKGIVDTDPKRGRSLSTYWHEVTHYAQVATMSYLYEWTHTLLEKVVAAVSEARGQSVEEFLASDFLRIDPGKLSPVGKTVAEDLLSHLALLDARGDSGLSPRMIFESHAFITQWRLNRVTGRNSGRAFTMLEMLSEFCPSDTYRVAYDFVRFYFGEEAAEIIFLPAAALSLCTPHPVATFERIVLESASNTDLHAAIRSGDAEEVYEWLQVLADADFDETAPEVCVQNQGLGLRHPTFTAAAERLVERPDLVDNFFRAPESYIHELLDVVRHPVVVHGAPTADGFPMFLPEEQNNAEGVARATATVALAAAANAVLGSAYDFESISPRQEKSLHWLTRPSHDPVRVPVDAGSLASGDVSAITQALTPLPGPLVAVEVAGSSDGEYREAFVPAEGDEDVPTFSWYEAVWGRLLLDGGGREEESEELWVSFIATLARQLPHVLAYLDLSHSVWQQQMLRFSLSEPNPDGTKPGIVLRFAERVAAAGQHGVEVGVEPWIQARLLTHWLPDELRDLLIEASAGQAGAMYRLGVLARDDDPVDLQSAREWFLKAAQAGDVDAMHELAMTAYRLVPSDLESAQKWFLKAAEAGDVHAMYNLGALAHEQVPPDRDSAEMWYHRAANAGHVEAMNSLGALAAQQVPPDLETARTWLLKAAKAGSAEAMRNLGALATQQVPPDLETARTWLLSAAKAGSAKAMMGLAMLAEDEDPPDLKSARTWYQRAAQAGDSDAVDYLRAQFGA